MPLKFNNHPTHPRFLPQELRTVHLQIHYDQCYREQYVRKLGKHNKTCYAHYIQWRVLPLCFARQGRWDCLL